MNIKLCTATLVLAVMAAPVFSESVVSEETTEASHSYIGIKGGPLIISRDIPFNNDGVMLGILYGYDIPDNNFSIEAEFNTTVSKATSDTPGFGDLGVTTLGGYGVYRSAGRVYVKGKLGILYEYLTSSVSGFDVDGPSMSLSLGVGAGMRISDRLSAEFEYTMIEADIGYATLGVNWQL